MDSFKSSFVRLSAELHYEPWSIFIMNSIETETESIDIIIMLTIPHPEISCYKEKYLIVLYKFLCRTRKYKMFLS